MNTKHFISITDLSAQEIWEVLKLAKIIKSQLHTKGENKLFLKNNTLAMIFEKPSLRTRLSFETAMTQLGGHAIYLAPADIGMGKRESVSDTSKVVSSMVDVIMARTFKHETIVEMAKNSQVPVINGLSDLEHPCQILADLMTIWELKGKLTGLTIGYVGDGENNIIHPLCLASAILGINLKVGAPKGFWMNEDIVKQAHQLAVQSKSNIYETMSPDEAVTNVDVVVTDTWISMGDETEKEKRLKIFKQYQVNNELMKHAKKDAIFLHCLPAYRGNEVSSDVIDGQQSVVFQEAENRLHVQKGLLMYLLKGVKNI